MKNMQIHVNVPNVPWNLNHLLRFHWRKWSPGRPLSFRDLHEVIRINLVEFMTMFKWLFLRMSISTNISSRYCILPKEHGIKCVALRRPLVGDSSIARCYKGNHTEDCSTLLFLGQGRVWLLRRSFTFHTHLGVMLLRSCHLPFKRRSRIYIALYGNALLHWRGQVCLVN